MAIRGLDMLLTRELADTAIPDDVPRFQLDFPPGGGGGSLAGSVELAGSAARLAIICLHIKRYMGKA
jgi:hypothetical protein